MPRRRWKILAVIVLAAGFWVTRLGASPLSSARVITIQASQWKYSPGVITVNEGDRVTLRLTTDDVTHGFYLDGYGITTAVIPHETTEIHFLATKSGRWMFRCSVTCGPFHPYMIGWLRVQPNTTVRWGWVFVSTVGLTALYAAWEEARPR
jgi:heme/copper-type cytochrome/quinol oxidase subunit 2